MLLLAYQVLKLILGKRDYMSRLNRYTNIEEVKNEKKRSSRKESGRAFGEAISRGIGKAKFLDGYKKKLQTLLSKAHLLLKRMN